MLPHITALSPSQQTPKKFSRQQEELVTLQKPETSLGPAVNRANNHPQLLLLGLVFPNTPLWRCVALGQSTPGFRGCRYVISEQDERRVQYTQTHTYTDCYLNPKLSPTVCHHASLTFSAIASNILSQKLHVEPGRVHTSDLYHIKL